MPSMQVTGMHCQHCSQSVEKAVKAIAGIASVTVDLEAASVSWQVQPGALVTQEQVSAAIAGIGFEPA